MNAKSPHMTHYARRIQHALTGILFYFLSFLISKRLASYLLVIGTFAFYTFVHLGRKKFKCIQDVYLNWFGALLREHEKQLHRLPGAFWFLLGTTIVVLCFNIHIARISILCLSLGDPIAALVGIKFGRYGRDGILPQNKSMLGCVTCYIVCFFICFGHISVNENSNETFSLGGLERSVGKSMLTAFVATVMECYGTYFTSLDDNLLMPLGVATTLGMFDYYAFQ